MKSKIVLSKETVDSLNLIKNQLKVAFDAGKITKGVFTQFTYLANKTLYDDTDPMFQFNNALHRFMYESISCPFCDKELGHNEWVSNNGKIDFCMYCDSEVVKVERVSPYVKR